MIRRGTAVVLLILTLGLAMGQLRAAGGRDAIKVSDLTEWLGYIASDELEGRSTYSAGLGLTAGYIQERLREWKVKPAGDGGSYLQTVRVLGVRATSRSSLTVTVGNESRTFKDGDGLTFPRNVGGKQHLVIDRVEFMGYGLDAPGVGHRDFQDSSIQGSGVVFLGNDGPESLDAAGYRRILSGRARYATDIVHAAAVLGPPPSSRPAAPPANRPATQPDFTTTQRLDSKIPPAVQGSDELFEFLFSKAPTPYSELARLARERKPLPHFRLDDVSLTFDVDADYSVVRTQHTQNIVAVVEGGDSRLKNSYVAFGAHYDHVGYAESEVSDGRRPNPPGRVTRIDDRIWNGADDDGSGTVALLALAKAFAQGPRPRRSLLFVWHSGEERGLLGSRYFADYPTVPLDRIVAQLNIDMIGRNRDDKASEINTVYLVGSDRISSELHQLNREANAALPTPLTLDYEMNDPSDQEQVYYRSDHYSYAAKGIPIIFFTTGLHPDYHANTDEVSKIEFAKLARITQLIYETGRRVAELDHAPARDNLGPRAGKGTR